MDRILARTQADIKVTFYVAGVATDADLGTTPTVTIYRENGEILVDAASTVKVEDTTGIYAYTLSPEDTAQLDVLKADWEAVIGEASQTFETAVEIVGGFTFSVAESRARNALSNPDDFSVEDIATARAIAEWALDEAAGVAFVPRYARDVLDGPGGVDVLLRNPRPLDVLAAAISGTAITAADVELYTDGRAYYSTGWPAGRRNLEITYTHGYAQPPPRVGHAALLLAEWLLVESPIDLRTTQLVTEQGTQSFVTAGVRNAIFNIPEANAIAEMYDHRIKVA